jgi:hypothetical protein
MCASTAGLLHLQKSLDCILRIAHFGGARRFGQRKQMLKKKENNAGGVDNIGIGSGKDVSLCPAPPSGSSSCSVQVHAGPYCFVYREER